MSNNQNNDGKGQKESQADVDASKESFYTARSHVSNEEETAGSSRKPSRQRTNTSETDFAPSEEVLQVKSLRDTPANESSDQNVPVEAGDKRRAKDNNTGFDADLSADSDASVELPLYKDRPKNNDPGGFGSKFSLHGGVARGYAFIYMVKPPDGGYGWVIAFFSFLAQIVVDGIIFSIGVSLPTISKEFDVGAASVCLISSLQMGGLASAFINKYGFRPVAIFGCGFATITILISSFSVNLPMMIIFFSVLGGPALSSIWVPSQLIIGYYFEKYRPIANGLSCSGAGAGIMIFVIVNNILVPIIGWRNMQRIHAGCVFIVLFMVFSYRPVPPKRIGQVKETEEIDDTDTIDENESTVHTQRFSLRSFGRNSIAPAPKLTQIWEEFTPEESKTSFFQRCCKCCKRRKHKVRSLTPTGLSRKSYVIRPDPMEKQDFFYMGPANYEERRASYVSQTIDITPGQNTEAINYNISLMNTTTDSGTAKQKDQIKKPRTCKERMAPSRWIPPKMMRAFRMLFDFRLFKIFEFRVLIVSAFLFPMGFNIPFLYSKARAKIDPFYASMIGPSIGLSNFVFRIVSGFMAFYYRKYTTYMCGWGLVFGGAAVLVSAFWGYDVVWFQILYALCYGIAPAFFSTLRAIIYVRYLGLDKLTNAFGLISLLMGLGVFLGTSVAGLLNELTGDYVASFSFSGICIIGSGALKLILPYLVQWREQGRCCFKKRNKR